MPKTLSADEVRHELTKLPGWAMQDGALRAKFEMGDFQDAIAALVQIAITAEKLNHHPDIAVSYNKISFSCSTHDAGHTVTELDVAIATQISRIVNRLAKLAR